MYYQPTLRKALFSLELQACGGGGRWWVDGTTVLTLLIKGGGGRKLKCNHCKWFSSLDFLNKKRRNCFDDCYLALGFGIRRKREISGNNCKLPILKGAGCLGPQFSYWRWLSAAMSSEFLWKALNTDFLFTILFLKKN